MSRLNPAALGVADAARVLSRIGGKPVTDATRDTLFTLRFLAV